MALRITGFVPCSLMVLAFVTATSSARASGSGSHLDVATAEPADGTAASTTGLNVEPRVDRAVRTESTEWYGAPIIALDVAALALPFIGAGIARDDPTAEMFAFGAVGLYALGGPIVHFSEDRVGAGFGSLGLRLGAPVLGGAVGLGIGAAAVSGCTGEMCGLGALVPAVAGVGIGMLTAVIVDSAVLARKPVARTQLSLSVIPTYQPTTDAKGVAVSGTW